MATAAIPANKFTTKQILIAAGVLLLIIIIVALWFYYKGKKTTTIAPVPVDNPSGTGTNNPAGVSTGEISKISSDLHADMDGFNWSGHDVAPFQALNGLSDTDFTRVYNQFNTSYQAASGETLKQWIEGESFAFNDVVESILSRMGRLLLI